VTTTFIALLRGVNVGAKNRIKMADLAKLFETLGLSRVETYIQSGNVIFGSDREEGVLREKLEKAIESAFGFSAAVILRTAGELERIILDCPFTDEEASRAEAANTEGESRYIALLAQPPSREMIERLDKYEGEQDKYRLIGRNIYLLFHHSIRNSKLAVQLDKAGIPSTVRNWKTINKLYEIARERHINR
jgi:uncharacterized protein (DUF1697 family)